MKSNNVSFGKVVKIGVGYIMALFLCLALFLLTAVVVAKTVLTNKYTVSRLPKTYCASLYADIQNSLNDYTIPTGLDLSVLDGVISEEQVEIDFNSVIRNSHPGDGYTLDTSTLEEKLNLNVTNFLEQNSAIDEESSEAVDKYVREIGELYRKNIRLPGLDYIARLSEEFESKFFIFLIAVLFIAVLFAFILVMVQRRPTKSLRFFSYATGGVAAMMLIGPLVAMISGFYKHLGITPDYFNAYMVSYADGIMIRFMVVAAVWLAISVGFAVFARNMEKKRRRRYKAQEIEEE